MKPFVCIHGHFYQPPRENPWLEDVEVQDSAYPYHDWNKRITAECYAPNTASRILDSEMKIVDIVNNYKKISFNFGPTLLSWMQENEPETYNAIIEADRASMERYDGHGSALAQVYNHMIMPLANKRDKRTQVLWGIKDFQHRFGRDPEGMWLAETAVDIETLELLAEQGIRFTILAPRQAKSLRSIGQEEWTDVSESNIDPKYPYLCNLPSGRSINLFFYDGPVSREVAFSGLLDSGTEFAARLMGAFVHEEDRDQIVHIATDGETFGHHHRYGDMALAFCLYQIESNQEAQITIYGRFLDDHQPAHEVQIYDNSSWSCVHGVERWKQDCGCNTGMNPGWTQAWRAPLRGAMDWLRDSLTGIFEGQASNCLSDPWAARDDYIQVILDRSPGSVDNFFSRHSSRELSGEDRVRALKLLEMQRHAMLMYTSCGWFFDEVSGVETVQVLLYAARAMQLAKEVAGIELEPAYLKILERAPSNVPAFADGAGTYRKLVQPSVLDLNRVGAHYAVYSVFERFPETTGVYCYTARNEAQEVMKMGRQRLAVGRAGLSSEITLEESHISYAVLYFGDHNLMGGVSAYPVEESFEGIKEEIKTAFQRADIPEVMNLMDRHFGAHNYSLWHLFKDEQRRIMEQVVDSTIKEIEFTYRQVYERNYPVMQALHELSIPLPGGLATAAEYVFNLEAMKLLDSEKIDVQRLEQMVEEVKKWSLELDRTTLGFVGSRTLTRLMERLAGYHQDLALLEEIESLLRILNGLSLELDLWKAQNIYFQVSREFYQAMADKAGSGDQGASKWIDKFNSVGEYLRERLI